MPEDKVEKMEENKKRKISSEQIEKACEHMGSAAVKVDSAYDNIKGNLGQFGKTLGFAIVMTFIIALFVAPSLVWVLGICLAIGSAPALYKKGAEFSKSAEDSQKKKLAAKLAAKTLTDAAGKDKK